MSHTNLVVVAHPDDEVLGFGGTGAALVERGELVRAAFLCGHVDVRSNRPSDRALADDIKAANDRLGFSDPLAAGFPNIRMNTVPHIELVQFIEKCILETEPTRIFTHHPADPNDDHRQVSRACMAAFRLFQRRPGLRPVELLSYVEVLSSTEWAADESLLPFRPNSYFDITATLTSKIDALGCYRNVMRDEPHPRSARAIEALSVYRGAQAGVANAEAFQTVFQRNFR